MEVLGTLQGEEGNFEEMVIKLEVLVRAIRPQQKGGHFAAVRFYRPCPT